MNTLSLFKNNNHIFKFKLKLSLNSIYIYLSTYKLNNEYVEVVI